MQLLLICFPNHAVQCENKVKYYEGTPEVFQFDTNLLFACDENHPQYTKYLQDVRFLAKRGHELPELQISMSFVLLLLRTPPTCMFNCSIVSQNFFWSFGVCHLVVPWQNFYRGLNCVVCMVEAASNSRIFFAFQESPKNLFKQISLNLKK